MNGLLYGVFSAMATAKYAADNWTLVGLFDISSGRLVEAYPGDDVKPGHLAVVLVRQAHHGGILSEYVGVRENVPQRRHVILITFGDPPECWILGTA